MKILIRKDGQFFKEVDFTKDEIILGRSNDTDIQLFDADVSRKHSKITKKGNKIYVEDLGSKNGTLVKDAPIKKTILKTGEIFSVGPFSISVESIAPSQQPTVVEHDIDSEDPTRSFQENTGITNTARSINVKELLQKQEKEIKKETPEEDDSDSFLKAIAVSPSSSLPPERPSEEVMADEEDDDDFEEVEDSKIISFEKSNAGFLEEREDEEPLEEHKELSEKEIKTEIQEPATKVESTIERSLKDFPSATEIQKIASDKDNEQFFFNREIDNAGIPESFENFPDTNKIKLQDEQSSFSQATKGRIEEKEENTTEEPLEKTDPLHSLPSHKESTDSNAISTKSFAEAKTVIAPKDEADEDQIKTSMFNTKDLPPDLQEKTDEFSKTSRRFSKLALRISSMKPVIKQWIQKPKNRKIAFISSAVILSIAIFMLMEGDIFFHHEPVNPETAINSEEGFQKLRRSEKKRVILFQIDQIQKLVINRNIGDADERMKKLMTLASKDADFVKYEKEYQHQRELILAEEAKKQKEQEERLEQKNKLMADAKQMIDAKQFDMAKKNYLRGLELFPDDTDIQEKMRTLEILQEQEERKAFSKQQRYSMLSKIYTAGVEKYESGQLGVAQKLFKQVTSEKGHPKYKSALEYLNKIENMTDKKINQKIAAAKQMIQTPENLIQGYQELKKIVTQFPMRSDAKKYLADAKVKMDKKAREVYADALAQEELAGDPGAALDLYKEVLKYAPDASNKYHQKAQEKINALQL